MSANLDLNIRPSSYCSMYTQHFGEKDSTSIKGFKQSLHTVKKNLGKYQNIQRSAAGNKLHKDKYFKSSFFKGITWNTILIL